MAINGRPRTSSSHVLVLSAVLLASGCGDDSVFSPGPDDAGSTGGVIRCSAIGPVVAGARTSPPCVCDGCEPEETVCPDEDSLEDAAFVNRRRNWDLDVIIGTDGEPGCGFLKLGDTGGDSACMDCGTCCVATGRNTNVGGEYFLCLPDPNDCP